MLKLKRISREQQIHVFIRDPERQFSHTFLMALGIAVGIHLTALLVFHVIPFRLSFDGPLLPPVHVESDLAAPMEVLDSGVLANTDRDLAPLRYYLEPKKSMPSLPKPPQSSLVRQVEYIKESSIATNPFLGLESDLLQPDFEVFDKTAVNLQPFDLFLTGTISGAKLIDDGLRDKFLPNINQLEKQYRATYAVQVESQTGHIFWFEPKQTTAIEVLDKLAEKILLDMKFIKDKKAFVLSGEVEILFNLG